MTKMPNEHFQILFRGYPNSSYRLEASPDLNPDNFEQIATFGVGEGEGSSRSKTSTPTTIRDTSTASSFLDLDPKHGLIVSGQAFVLLRGRWT